MSDKFDTTPLPKKLSNAVRKRMDDIPWVISKKRGTVVIPFGRKYNPKSKSSLLIKKYEILFGIREFYTKHFGK